MEEFDPTLPTALASLPIPITTNYELTEKQGPLSRALYSLDGG